MCIFLRYLLDLSELIHRLLQGLMLQILLLKTFKTRHSNPPLRRPEQTSWLVGCFGFNGPFRQYFSLYRALSQREGQREEKRYRRVKMSKQPPTRTYCKHNSGWSGGAMVLGKRPVPGRPTIWIIVGQGPTALAVGTGGGCLDISIFIYPFSPLSPSLWETARYRLKYCLKGPLNPNQPTNKHNRPLPYYHPNCRTPRHWKFTQDHRTTQPPLEKTRDG